MTETSFRFDHSNLVIVIYLEFGACDLVLPLLVLPINVRIRIPRIGGYSRWGFTRSLSLFGPRSSVLLSPRLLHSSPPSLLHHLHLPLPLDDSAIGEQDARLP